FWNVKYLAVLAAMPMGVVCGEPIYQPVYMNAQIQAIAPYPNNPQFVPAQIPAPVVLPQQRIQPIRPALQYMLPAPKQQAPKQQVQKQTQAQKQQRRRRISKPPSHANTIEEGDPASEDSNDSDAVSKLYGDTDNIVGDDVAPRFRNAGAAWPIAQSAGDNDVVPDSWPVSDAEPAAEETHADAEQPKQKPQPSTTSVEVAVHKPVAKARRNKAAANAKPKPAKTLASAAPTPTAATKAVSLPEPPQSSAPAQSATPAPAATPVVLTPATSAGASNVTVAHPITAISSNATATHPIAAAPSNATALNAVALEAAPAANGVMRIAASPHRPDSPTVPLQDVLGDVRNNPSSGASMGYHGHKMVRGVNIGGFLVPEFWITPSLIAGVPDPKPGDYLELCKRLGAEATLQLMRRHWETWVTEAEVQRLAGAGLTHLRVPIGHWEFVDSDDGYVRGGLPYFKRLVYWASKYGLRVIADMHTAPGSQNGFDNSGTTSGVNWTNDARNVALSKRALQTMLKYIASDPVVLATVDAIDLLNEPLIDLLDFEQLWEYDTGGHTLVTQGLHRVPPVVSIVDRGFKDFSWWQPRWPRDWNSKYIDAWLDAHLYHVFDRNIDGWPLENHLRLVCQNGRDLKSNSTFFPIIVGEWSLALPQAALAGRENEARRRFAEAQLDAYELGGAGWVFWCFKTESSPEWSFLDALDRSWIPQPLTNREFPPICH
ncbi:hypothetical protein H4R23_004382, partial [Coemansia sp. Cherry 401B]